MADIDQLASDPDNPKEFTQVTEFMWKMPIEGMCYIKEPTFGDHRGFFREIYNKRIVTAIQEQTGIDFSSRQENFSYSDPGVARGIHVENVDKLIRVYAGEIMGMWMDLRPESTTFLQACTYTLNMHTGSILIPRGVGNSFFVTSTDQGASYGYTLNVDYRELTSEDKLALDLFDPFVIQTLEKQGVKWPPYENANVSKRDSVEATSFKNRFPNIPEISGES